MRLLWLVVALVLASLAFAQADPAEKDGGTPAVDVELVIAADVSYSMNKDDLALRREGYAQAIASSELIETLKAGPIGKLAITYVEWSSPNHQKVVVPWRVIDGPESAAAVAAEIIQAPADRQGRTSITGAINFAVSLFESDPARGSRRVIDISGDGPNNSGGPILAARDAALGKGITVNGLPITFKGGASSPAGDRIDNLDTYYEDCLAGGSASFVLTVSDRERLKEAIQTMLVSEVAGRIPERANSPSTGPEKRVSCLIGEELFGRIWNQPPASSMPPVPSTPPSFTAWQLSEFAAYTRKCFSHLKQPMRNKVALSASIGPDGRIVGDPEVLSPVDHDDFRADVRTAIRKLHRCEPYFVDPFAKIRVRSTQVFRFGFDELEETISSAIQANFRKCWTASRTGPTIWLNLTYKPDGTYGSPPMLVNPEKSEEYLRAATEVIRQINKCPPVKFPKGQLPKQSIKWQFPSSESVKASRPKT